MAWNNFLGILILFMLVFIKNSLQTQCKICKKDFKSLGPHVWRCRARLLNRETSIDSIITTSIGQSIVTLVTKLHQSIYSTMIMTLTRVRTSLNRFPK